MLNREQLEGRIRTALRWFFLPLLVGLWAFNAVNGHRRVHACKIFCQGHGQWSYRPAHKQDAGLCSCADHRQIAADEL